MAKNSERQLHSAVSTTRSVQRWPVTSQIIRAMVAVAAVFQFAVAQATEESPNQVALEAWPEETVVAFERVRLGEQSVIQGDVTVLFPDRTIAAAPGVESDKTAAVQGTVRTDVAATKLPSFPWFTPGGPEVRIAPGSSSNLSPGNYGRVTVGSSDGPPAVLTLAGGIYKVVSLQLGRSSRIECADACELRVLTTLRLDNSASLAPAQDAGIREEDIQLFVAGTDVVREGDIQAFIAGSDVEKVATVQLGEAAEIHGYLYAPNGTVALGPATNATGHIIGRTVRLERAARVSASPAGVSAGSTRVDQKELPVTRADGGVQTFRLEPDRQVRVEGLFVRNGASFGLGPADTVVEDDVRGSQESGLHRRYKQFHHGLPVLGADFIVQETKGLVISGIGRLVSGLDVDPNPELSAQAALELALKAIGAPPDGSSAPQGMPPSSPGMLAIASKGDSVSPGSFHLVYRFEVAAPRTNRGEMIDIDARTGEIVNRFPLIVHYTGGGDTLNYGWKPFEVESFDLNGQTRYRLAAPDFISGSSSPEVGITTVRALGLNPPEEPPPDLGFIHKDLVVLDFVDEDGDFRSWPLGSFEEANGQLPAALYGVSAHWGLQQAVDYWRKAGWNAMKAEWRGVDGKGSLPIFAVVDCAKYYGETNAAFIWPSDFCFSKIAHLQLIGHEFAHAVFNHATKASYTGEAGMINEGFADVFGYLLNPDTANWCGVFAEALTLSYKDPGADGSCNAGVALCPGEQCDQTGVCSLTKPLVCEGRNLSDPKKTQNPTTYKAEPYYVSTPNSTCDYCHHNSTIVGHWFYILLNGKQGTNDKGHAYNVVGIGRQKAEEIVQRTLLLKLGSAPTFLSLREASIQAAEDISKSASSPEVIAVTNAWYAVGVGQPYDPRSYSPANVSGVEPWPAVLKWEELDGETDWEVQVSTSSSFDSDVQVLASTGSEVQVIAPGKGFVFASHKAMLLTKVNLKPTTKYYWRVHSKSAEPPKKASGLDLAPEKKRVPWLRPGRGRKAPGAGSLSGTVLVQLPSVPDVFLGGWDPWGATQEFETGAKVPEPIAPAPPPPLKKIPNIVVAPGAYYPWNAEFSWKPVSGASRYRITVSESPNRSCGPSNTQQITFPSSLPTIESVPAPKTAGTVKKDFPLKSDHTYYWWLKVYGPGDIAGGCAYGGHPIRFKTSAPKTTLKSPADGDHVSPFQTTLEWSKVDGATGYVLQWAKTGAKLSPAGEPVDSLSAVIAPGAVGPHYWRVRPKGPLSGDMGAASSTWTFVADLELTKPKLLKPDGKKWEAYGEQVAFTWDRVPGATNYLLTIGRNANQAVGENPVQIDSGFSSGSVANIWVEDVSTHTEGYCWTVRASGVGGMAGATSDVWCYPIGAGRVEITSPQDGALDMKYDASTVSWTCPYCPGGFKVTYETGHSDGTCDHGPPYSKKLPSTENSHTRDDLKPATWYCVWVAGLNPDETEHGYGDSVWFRTKAKPAPCKPVAAYDISPMVPTAYTQVGQGWDRRLSWAEANSDIKEYKLFAWAHGPAPLQGGSPPVYTTWPSHVVPSAELDSGLKWGSAPILVWTLPSFIPWSPTQYNVDTYILEIAVSGRSVSEDQVCDWKEVGGFLVLVGE